MWLSGKSLDRDEGTPRSGNLVWWSLTNDRNPKEDQPPPWQSCGDP